MKIKIFCKDVLRLIFCSVIDYLAKKNPDIQDKTLVILRLDVIGDYVLFRNFLEILKSSVKYKDYKITLIGNEVFKDIALNFDSNYVDNFIFIKPSSMTRDYIYRYKIVREITSKGYDTLIAPVYSREFYVGELLVKRITSLNKISIKPNTTNMSNWQKNISKNYYTQLINTPSETIFEFNRTKIFFEKLLDRKIDIKKPIISLNKDTDLNLPKKYLTLFIGATTPFRCWPIENYVKVIEYILVNFQDLDILICGGVGELAESKKLTKIFQNERVRNYVGVTTLVGLIEIISKSRMLLSNESNAPHIAMAFDVHTIVLYNGFNFRRFAPYPKYMTNKYFLICHPKISNNFREYEIISNKRGYDRVLSMDDITVDEVVGQIENLDFILNKER